MENSSRVKLGNNISEILGVADKMTVKHLKDGNSSPLLALTDVNWTEFVSNVPKAVELNREAEELRMKAEAKCRERDLLMEPIEEAVRRGKNLLKSIHAKNPKMLGEWGFNVTYTTPKKTVAKTSTTENNQ